MRKLLETVLYFVPAGAPTPEHYADAEALETAHRVQVKFRNGTVTGNGSPEKTDYVAGEVIPVEYLKFPRITADGGVIANAEPTPAASTDNNSGLEANAGQGASLSDLASEIGTTGNTGGNTGWGTPTGT